ncbi:MAG: hypothetical protein WB992_09385 [Bryobacteraceae bacterium]
MTLGLAGVLSAQTVIQPGQTASASGLAIRPGDLDSDIGSSGMARNSSVARERQSGKVATRVWIASMFAAAGASALDADTSLGKREGNSLLASSNGTFGAKGVSIKAGIAAAVLVPQILLRHHRNLRTTFITGNFVDAGIFSAVAIHNMGLPEAKN